MPAIRFLLLCLLLLPLVVPAASAGFAVMSEATFEELGVAVVLVSATITGEDAAQTRTAIDNPKLGTGNGDGMVGPSEVEAFEDLAVRAANGFGRPRNDYGENVSVDGLPWRYFGAEEFEIQNAEGPVASLDSMQFSKKLRLEFAVRPAEQHRIHVELTRSGKASENSRLLGVEIIAPPGFVFPAESGFVSADQRRVTLTGNPVLTSNLEVQLMPVETSSGGESPGLGGLLVSAALVATAAGRKFRLRH